eukprot:COSAG02_NODE_35476_length_467_cov_8.035326_2_plen_43_part_01
MCLTYQTLAEISKGMGVPTAGAPVGLGLRTPPGCDEGRVKPVY